MYEYAVDIYINPDNNRWTGIVYGYPNSCGNPQELLHKKTGYQNSDMAEKNCDKFIDNHRLLLNQNTGDHIKPKQNRQ